MNIYELFVFFFFLNAKIDSIFDFSLNIVVREFVYWCLVSVIYWLP